jgi:hypothetical protein
MTPAQSAALTTALRFPTSETIHNRVVMLRGIGNSIVPQVAAAFVRAFMEATDRSPAP